MDDYKPVTQQELDRGYFFLTHRPLIRKIIIGVSIFILVILYAFLVWQAVSFFQGGSFQKMAAEMNYNSNWDSYHKSRAPLPLQVNGTQLISLGNRRYSLIAFVENPNTDWSIKEAQYRFIVNGEPLEAEYSFFNPEENRALVNLAYQSNDAASNLQIEFGNLAWQRVDESYREVEWEVVSPKYYPATRQTEGDRTFEIPARVTWQATNMSLYSFWEVGWQVLLLNNDKIVGVQEIISKDFDSLETRELEAVWLNALPRVTSAAVYPVFDNLDRDNYKVLDSVGGGLGL